MAASSSLAAPSSKIHGVQIGVITYSFRGMQNLDDIIAAINKIGINAVELMSNNAESGAGAPSMPFGPGGGRPPGGGPTGPGTARAAGPPTPEQMAAMRARMNSPEAQKAREELKKWRLSTTADTFKPVRDKFKAAGKTLHLLEPGQNHEF